MGRKTLDQTAGGRVTQYVVYTIDIDNLLKHLSMIRAEIPGDELTVRTNSLGNLVVEDSSGEMIAVIDFLSETAFDLRTLENKP